MPFLKKLFVTLFSVCLHLVYGRIDDCGTGFYFNGRSCRECGNLKIIPNVRIVGGIEATIGSWPTHALIIQDVYIQQFGISIRYFCAGIIINQRTILTAAHCIKRDFYFYGQKFTYIPDTNFPTFESTFRVFVGLYNISALTNFKEMDPFVKRFRVSRIIIHENFDENIKNDIALVITSRRIIPDGKIEIACLPEQSNSFPIINSSVLAPGWGKISENGPSSDFLMNVKLTVYNSSFCPNIDDGQICAGEYEGGKDTCSGDSGGGLYSRVNINNTTNKLFVSGITSYGPGCARKGLLGVYTRVSYYTNWIKARWAY